MESKVKFEDESGNFFEMIILKEFSYNNKNYAVLMEEHECDDKACNHEPNIGILEISKDKDGNEVFISIEDEKTFEEVVKKAEEALFED